MSKAQELLGKIRDILENSERGGKIKKIKLTIAELECLEIACEQIICGQSIKGNLYNDAEEAVLKAYGLI